MLMFGIFTFSDHDFPSLIIKFYTPYEVWFYSEKHAIYNTVF